MAVTGFARLKALFPQDLLVNVNRGDDPLQYGTFTIAHRCCAAQVPAIVATGAAQKTVANIVASPAAYGNIPPPPHGFEVVRVQGFHPSAAAALLSHEA